MIVEEEEVLNKRIISLNEKIVKLHSDSGVSIDELEKRLKILQKKKEDIKLKNHLFKIELLIEKNYKFN